MKIYILVVSGGDYAALEFEDQFKREDMLELIRTHLEVNEYSWVEDNNEGGEVFNCSLHVFENANIDFINFFADEFIDYDQSKHKNFWYFTEEEVNI